jgi:hypothetical protein
VRMIHSAGVSSLRCCITECPLWNACTASISPAI